MCALIISRACLINTAKNYDKYTKTICGRVIFVTVILHLNKLGSPLFKRLQKLREHSKLS